jgi:hypothetical protein
MFCESDSEVISHAAPTAWTNPPKFDANAAIHSDRNVWLRNRIRGEIWSGTDAAFDSDPV